MNTTTVGAAALPVPAQSGPPWSYSHLKNVETCPRRYYHYQVAKDVIEPESDELRAGNALHRHFQARLQHNVALPPGYVQFEGLLAKIKAAPGTLYTEQKLALTGRFQPCAWMSPNVWFRSISDCAVKRGNRIAVFDWKTGKPPGAYGEPDHTQLQLMAATFFRHIPDVETVDAALVFVHHEAASRAQFQRHEQGRIWRELLPRVDALQRARATRVFEPKPSGLCRRYCSVTSCAYHGKGG